MDEYMRNPCPWRIVDDCGGAFSMGAIGGSLFHGIKGARNAPKGFNRRLIGSLAFIKEKAPVTGGNFAAWGLLFSAYDCTFARLRDKEDAWNSVLSGVFTGATLSVRQGKTAMIANAAIGGIFLGLIEMASIGMNWFTATDFAPISPLDMPDQMGQRQGG